MSLKKSFIAVWLIIIGSGIAYAFWHQEWKYSLPTPVPSNYHAINSGTYVSLKDIPGLEHSSKPLFLHFFNPNCPCSRFNITHFKSLVNEYGDKIDFAVVALTSNRRYTEKDIQQKFDLAIPVVFDSSYAVACGVYSTPQAAIIDTGKRLYYRGNYNKSRYCTDKKTNYAQIAIDALLAEQSQPRLGPGATVSYGCTLPICKK
ncbi:MAG TPA: redoxin domain-containing protein [Chitinophagaceae bacterium]|jgi:hypothetical protein|nr:redoxin domain-containing protein [Chitinophagaceae bacterium]